MINYMRNTATGEIKEVAQDSAEFFGLAREVRSDGHPLWEQTGFHHADAVKARANEGTLEESDLGHDLKADVAANERQNSLEGVGAEKFPYKELTLAEVEMGMTPDQKAKEVAEMFDAGREATRAEALDAAGEQISTDNPAENPTGTVQATGETSAASQAAGVANTAAQTDKSESKDSKSKDNQPKDGKDKEA